MIPKLLKPSPGSLGNSESLEKISHYPSLLSRDSLHLALLVFPEDTAPLQLHAKSSARFRQGPGDADMEEVTTANRKLFHREDRGGWPGSSLAMVPHTTSRRGGENCPSLPAQNQPVPTLIGVHMGPCQLDIPIVMSSTKSDKP